MKQQVISILIGIVLLFGGSLVVGAQEAEKEFRPLPSSHQDFRQTLEAPAGKRGFLRVGKEGKFRWPDGTRARFWGINVSSTRLRISHAQIEQVVANFAKAGLNMVRLEAIDNRNCLLGKVDAANSLDFDPEYLDRIDYWMACLRRYGIYYYLDLLDFRTFKEGDGVLNADKLDRGARPYAVFDKYLIRLQKDYATQLLTHRNPYSGLRPIEDPALALVEICNEHGFFLYPEKLDTLVEPYRTDLKNRWNDWLRNRYPTREQLVATWSQGLSQLALREDEDPAQRSVDLPMLSRSPATANDIRRTPRRLQEGVEFLMEVQRDYFREMRKHLRSIGLKIPVTAVVSNEIAPDVASVALECDFTSENWYGDGPNEDARTPGVRYYSNRNTIRDDNGSGFAPFTAALRWNNRPVVVREWATPWPNRYRAASIAEALAYSALQDYDAVLLFGYQTNRAPNGAEPTALNDYAFQSDPTVWGLCALAGRAFLTGAIRPATRSLTLHYPPERLYAWPNGLTELHRAAYAVRLQLSTDEAPPRPLNGTHRTPTGTSTDGNTLRQLLDAWGRGGAPFQSKTLEAGIWRSDTGQITRYDNTGHLTIITPRLRLIAGEFNPKTIYDLGGGFRFSTPTAFGTLILLSLDGKPLETSQHYAVKMVSRAENTGEKLVKVPTDFSSAWTLQSAGTAPVLTFGRTSEQPTRLWREVVSKTKATTIRNALTLLQLNLLDGTWEMEIHNDRAELFCDTPGVVGQVIGRGTITPNQLLAREPAPTPAR